MTPSRTKTTEHTELVYEDTYTVVVTIIEVKDSPADPECPSSNASARLRAMPERKDSNGEADEGKDIEGGLAYTERCT